MDSATTDEFFPCLRRFEAAVQAEPEVLGLIYTGSLGRGTWDRFSDLDIVVWVADAMLEQASAVAPTAFALSKRFSHPRSRHG